MARVFVDVSAFTQAWFQPVYEEIAASLKVRFSYVALPKMVAEHCHPAAKTALTFYHLMGVGKRRDDAILSTAQAAYEDLCQKQCWINEKDCDDPHIFALAFSMPFDFLFTADADIANCRDQICRHVKKEFCQFSLITSAQNYATHRLAILS